MTGSDKDKTGSDLEKSGSDKARLEVIRTSLEGLRISQFPGGWIHCLDQESGRVSEICLIVCRPSQQARKSQPILTR